MSELIDWRGNKVEVGDTILYPVRGGSKMEINEAIVLELGENDHGWMSKPEPFLRARWIRTSKSWRNREIKNVTLINLGNVTVLAKANANV